MAQWVEPGQAMELWAGPMVITVREAPDGSVAIAIVPAAGVPVREPVVTLRERGGFDIDIRLAVEATV